MYILRVANLKKKERENFPNGLAQYFPNIVL